MIQRTSWPEWPEGPNRKGCTFETLRVERGGSLGEYRLKKEDSLAFKPFIHRDSKKKKGEEEEKGERDLNGRKEKMNSYRSGRV